MLLQVIKERQELLFFHISQIQEPRRICHVLSHVTMSQEGLAHPHGHALWMICPIFMEKQIFFPKNKYNLKKMIIFALYSLSE